MLSDLLLGAPRSHAGSTERPPRGRSACGDEKSGEPKLKTAFSGDHPNDNNNGNDRTLLLNGIPDISILLQQCFFSRRRFDKRPKRVIISVMPIPLPGHLDDQSFGDALELELQRRREEEPLRYVALNSAVERCARAWCDPEKKIVVFAAANGIGKTWGSVILLGWTIWPEFAPPWFQEQIIKKLEHTHKSFRIASTATEAGESGTLQGAIRRLWPRGRYQTAKLKKSFDCWFSTDAGWEGDVMTYEQDAREFEGATRGVIIYNEPPPKDIRAACLFRTRMGGFEVFSMTPLAEAAWIRDDLVERAMAGDKSISFITGELQEACKTSLHGHLDKTKLDELAANVDPDEAEARLLGRFMHLSGLIYKFDHNLHVAKQPLDVLPVAPKFQVVDPGGFGKPYAVIWGQVVAAPPHGLQILREWPDGSKGNEGRFERIKDPGMTIEGYAKMFAEVEANLKIEKSSVRRVLDRRFGHVRDTLTGKSMREHFSDLGYFFEDSYAAPSDKPEMRTGVEIVRGYLKMKDAACGAPGILIDPSCVNTIRAFGRWAIDPKTQKPRDDVWKNFMDVVRYVCNAGLRHELSEPDSAWNENAGLPVWG